MEIKKGDYIIGTWHGYSPRFNADFICTALKRGNEWLVEYRFRYHADDKVWGSADRKSGRAVSIDGALSEEAFLMKLRVLLDAVRVDYHVDWGFVEVRGDSEKWIYTMAQQDWAHVKSVSKDEADRMERGE